MQRVFIFSLILFLFPVLLCAQEKYAVVIGVNDYYQSPGVKHPSSLHGCVNDAVAIKELLQNRFGFISANVHTLFDEQVTKKTVVGLLHQILDQCKAGDAFVFYFSGHGVWIRNVLNDNPVKRKMNQAMVMSDLYSPALDCLFTDEMIKQILNEFVDKKVIVTSLFDCCFSGNLPMKIDILNYWSPTVRKDPTKSLGLDRIEYVPVIKQPTGCPDSTSTTIDTDGDGVPDCKDWEINSPVVNEVDSLGITIEHITAEEVLNNITDTTGKAFNLKDTLNVNLAIGLRPSERKRSGFLSFSASSDVERAEEISDETGTKHGAFTKALITVYKTNRSDMPVSSLIKKVAALIKEQGYQQTPAYHYEGNRLNNNLIGINSAGFSNSLKARCVSNIDDVITIDKGLLAGVVTGNIFSFAGKKVKISQASGNTATGIDKTRSIKAGQTLELTDNYVVSGPMIKIFIPTANFTPASFQKFFELKIASLASDPDYADYDVLQDGAANTVTIFDDAHKQHSFSNERLMLDKNEVYKVVLLPIPSYIAALLKSNIETNQNIELVSKADKADYVLYLNYIKKKPKKDAAFVFYYHPRVEDQINTGVAVFSKESLRVPSVNVTSQSLQALVQKLQSLTIKAVRYKTTAWMNSSPKRGD